MFRYLTTLLTIISLLPVPAFALEVNGPLNNALMESAASDPVSDVIESRFYWNSTSKKPMIYNGTAWQEMGSGSGGSGEKNYLADNPSGAVNTDGWTCVGDLDIARTATAADLPRENTTGTGLKITADANTQSTADYCYFDFTLDDIDLNRKLNVKWAQKQTGSYVASDLAVIVTTQADRTTAVATPVVTNIPAYDGEFNGNGFDTASTATLSLVIRATTDMATNAGIVISDVIVGPGQIQAVPAVGSITAPTITWNNSTGLTPTNALTFDRVGENLIINGLTTFTGTGSSGSAITLTLSGLTITSSTSGSIRVEETTTGYSKSYIALASSGNLIFFTQNNGSVASVSVKGTDVGNSTSGDINAIYFNGVTVRIAEWAGAPNYAGQNDVEYYATGGTWDAASSTTTYGPSGATMSGALTAERTKTITTLTPISQTDQISLELKSTGNSAWVPISVYGYGWQKQNSVEYGAFATVSGTNTITVVFEQYAYPNGATFGAAGAAWTNTTQWRVVKAKAGAAVGFGAASETSLGLVKAASSTFTVNVTGPVTISGSWRARRVGDIVTLSWPQMITTGASSATAMTLSFTNMPSWARPLVDTATACFTRDNATYGATPSHMSIPTSGNGSVNKTYASSAFTSNAGSTGIEVGSISYVGAAW